MGLAGAQPVVIEDGHAAIRGYLGCLERGRSLLPVTTLILKSEADINARQEASRGRGVVDELWLNAGFV